MKTKYFVVLSLVVTLISAIVGQSQAEVPVDNEVQTPLRVTIAIPQFLDFGSVVDGAVARILTTHPNDSRPNDAHFFVVLENISQQPLWLADEQNSIGYGTLSFQLTFQDGSTATIARIPRPWFGNSLRTLKLDPGDSAVREIWYNRDNDWPKLPFPTKTPRIVVTLRAQFEQKPLRPELGVWSGKVLSKPYQVVLEQNG